MLRSGDAEWLISPEARRWHGGVQPCVCHPFVTVQAAPIAIKVEAQLHRPSGHNAHCAVANCPDSYGKAKYLVPCGGCSTRATRERHTMAHISCAQAAGSGWHVQWKNGEDEIFSVEVLCPGCHDCELDMNDEWPRYRSKAPSDKVATSSLVSDDEYSNAEWTFQDWAHGPCGGFHFVGRRLGGLCTGACDNSAK
jgi:hypothetical protein